jgi:hypothetical protein
MRGPIPNLTCPQSDSSPREWTGRFSEQPCARSFPTSYSIRSWNGCCTKSNTDARLREKDKRWLDKSSLSLWKVQNAAHSIHNLNPVGGANMIHQIKHFFTELLHPIMRSWVQWISVPSHTAEVSW